MTIDLIQYRPIFNQNSVTHNVDKKHRVHITQSLYARLKDRITHK